MAAQPTDRPDWATTGTDNVEPTTGYKSAGFQGSEKPPAQYFNWFWELVSRWITYVQEGILLRESLTDDSPVLTTCDQAGNARHYVGAEGYFMGPAIQTQYYWFEDASYSVDGTQVSASTPLYSRITLITGASVTTSPPGALPLNTNTLDVSITASNADGRGSYFSQNVGNGNNVIYNLDDVVAVIEGSFATNNVVDGGAEMFFGFCGGTNLGTAVSRCGFVLSPASATLRAYSAAAGDAKVLASTDVANTIATNTLYHMRVEYHGANTPLGVAASNHVARFFLDGALIHEEVGGGPIDSGSFGPFFGATEITAGNTPHTLRFGPVRAAWNLSLAGTVPA